MIQEKWRTLFAREKKIVSVGGNKTLLLDNREYCYLILDGKVDIFSMTLEEDGSYGARMHAFHLEAGQFFFAFSPAQFKKAEMALLVSGAVDTRLLCIRKSRLRQLARTARHRPLVAEIVDSWVDLVFQSMVGERTMPREFRTLEAGTSGPFPTGTTLTTGGGMLWLQQQQGNARFLEIENLPPTKGRKYFPLPRNTWLEIVDEAGYTALATGDWLRKDPSWTSLELFHSFVLQMLVSRTQEEEVMSQFRMLKRDETRRDIMAGALRTLSSVLTLDRSRLALPEEGEDELLSVAREVGDALDMEIKPAFKNNRDRSIRDPLQAIAQASRIRVRRVALKGNWWEEDNGPMIGYLEEEEMRPVALLQRTATSYEVFDPQSGERTPLSEDLVPTIHGFADVFYRTLPARPLKGKDILRFSLAGRGKDFLMVFVMGFCAGLLALFTPVATGMLFNNIIPGAQLSQLFMVSMALLVAAIGKTVFEFARSISVLRIQGRMDQHLQGAVWDRLLELPIPFFRRFSAGDLAERAMGISAIRQQLSGTTVNSIVSGVFTVFNLILLFVYSSHLALRALLLAAVAVIFTLVFSFVQLRIFKRMTQLQGEITGQVLEFITGISKFRVAGCEGSAFGRWAVNFTRMKREARRSLAVGNVVDSFSAIFPILASIVIFYLIVNMKENKISVGDFLAFNAAFGTFLAAMLGIINSLMGSLTVVPYYQRAKPIMDAIPEADEEKADPGILSGDVEVSHVSFSYGEDGPQVLQDVSLQANRGEFIALVGPSGSGKSTLLRLLLGFEEPQTGAVLYDSQDLAGLDVRAVRQQLGVVLQNGQVMAGDILSNITGNSTLTIEDAWEAAAMAGLDKDIASMPMGMHTILPFGGGTLSGGQRQRLLIARALVTRPKIIFFDEATSALDNETQAVVNESLEQLQTTRIVIAHRLSTIIKADRIYVLQRGQVVQAGNYDQLMARPGVFAELAKRQIT